ncbi:MAG: DUF4159 domain-containing protein [Planctomycetota bacterium]
MLTAFGLRTQPAHADVSPDEIRSAVEILKGNLYRMQDERTGGWFGTHDETPALDDPSHDAGLAVLATYALLASGESPEVDERLANAVAFVEKSQREWTKEVDGSYVIGIRNHIWPLLPREKYRSALERDTKRLLEGADERGCFSYRLSQPPKGKGEYYDHSTTQYGVLGLWEAAKQDARIPASFWERVTEHFIDAQHSDGGWSYNPSKDVSKTMTAAGLTVLTIAQQELGRNNKTVNPQMRQAIDRGLARLDAMFDQDKNSYGGGGYWIYSVERVGLATGRSRFGTSNGGRGTDWFDFFARYIIDRVHKPSDDVHSQVVNSSFFLLFLARGDTPVFFNKLDLTAAGLEWNHRPNDIYFLAKQLSETFRSELNFRTVPIDWAIERWLGAPMSFVSVDEPIELPPAQIQTIKRYLDLGGMLVVNPEDNERRVLASVDAMLDAMYPGAKLEEVPDDHPVLGLWRPVKRPPALRRYHNGVRDLVLVLGDDIGFDWQRGGRNAEDAYVLGANLYLHTTGYQRMDGRAATSFPADPGSNAQGPKKTVAVVTPEVGLEPGLWQRQRRELGRPAQAASRSRTNPRPAEVKPNADLAVIRQAWDDAGQPVNAHGQTAAPDLLHLVGVTGTQLPDDAVRRVIDYAADGGTVLIETLGGTGDFAAALEEQFAAALGQPPERLSRYEDVFAADRNQNTFDLGRVTYRAYSVRNFNTDNKPRLAGFRIENRPAIFVSGEDLSLAAMGVRHWGLHGYSDASARQLLSNLLLNNW